MTQVPSPMLNENELMTADEVITFLENYVCDCGYACSDLAEDLQKTPTGVRFECPQCGDSFVFEDVGFRN